MIITGHGRNGLGLEAVWICTFSDFNYRGLVIDIVFRRGKWKDKKV